MNELARIVHDQVAGRAVTRTNLVSSLSIEERAALDDLAYLLQRTPLELAAYLAQAQPAVDWFTPPSRSVQLRD